MTQLREQEPRAAEQRGGRPQTATGMRPVDHDGPGNEDAGSARTGNDGAGTVPLAQNTTGQTPPPPRKTSKARVWGSAVFWGMAGFAVLIAIWWLFAPDRLPTPLEVGQRLLEDISDPFYDAGPNDKGIAILLAHSLGRVLEGFALAAVVGIPLGLAMGTSTKWWNATNPVVQLLRPVSPLAWFPIWAVIFMDADQASIWVIFVTALWPIAINTAAGAAEIDEDQKKVAKVFKFGKVAYIRHVLLPNTLSAIVTGMRLAFGMAWLVIVAVEMLGTVIGIGNDTWIAYNGRALDQMMANIVWIGLLGLIVDVIFLRTVSLLTKKEKTA